jgi:hypothetical protein
MPAGDFFDDMMNTPQKCVVSRIREKPLWRHTTIIRDDVVAAVRALKNKSGQNILTDGSSQLVRTLLTPRPGRRITSAAVSGDTWTGKAHVVG